MVETIAGGDRRGNGGLEVEVEVEARGGERRAEDQTDRDFERKAWDYVA